MTKFIKQATFYCILYPSVLMYSYKEQKAKVRLINNQEKSVIIIITAQIIEIIFPIIITFSSNFFILFCFSGNASCDGISRRGQHTKDYDGVKGLKFLLPSRLSRRKSNIYPQSVIFLMDLLSPRVRLSDCAGFYC